MSVAIFIHVAAINNYMQILNDFKRKINDSKLIDIADVINICVSGSSDLSSNGKYVVSANGDILQFEFPTLNKLKIYAQQNPDSNILYIHTKGVSAPNNQCIIDWCNYMSYFVIEKFDDRLKDLVSFDTCGVDLRHKPVLHYSGNFWWAKASHINTLPDFKDMPVVLSERHKAEFWICSRSENHKLIWDCGINQYQRHLHKYPEDRYRNTTMSLLDGLAKKYGTDKQISGGHGYTKYYARFFDDIRLSALNVLELGVREGRSIKMWHDYFENSLIWGIDNNAEGKCPDKFDEKRIFFRLGSQDDQKFLTDVVSESGGFDIIMDDCSHISPLTIRSFEILFPTLKPGGYYIIEDLQACDCSGYKPYGPSTIEYISNINKEDWGIFDIELFNKKIYFIKKV